MKYKDIDTEIIKLKQKQLSLHEEYKKTIVKKTKEDFNNKLRSRDKLAIYFYQNFVKPQILYSDIQFRNKIKNYTLSTKIEIQTRTNYMNIPKYSSENYEDFESVTEHFFSDDNTHYIFELIKFFYREGKKQKLIYFEHIEQVIFNVEDLYKISLFLRNSYSHNRALTSDEEKKIKAFLTERLNINSIISKISINNESFKNYIIFSNEDQISEITLYLFIIFFLTIISKIDIENNIKLTSDLIETFNLII